MSLGEKPQDVKLGIGPHGVRVVAVNGGRSEPDEVLTLSNPSAGSTFNSAMLCRATLKPCTCTPMSSGGGHAAVPLTPQREDQNHLLSNSVHLAADLFAAPSAASAQSGSEYHDRNCEQHHQQSVTYDQIDSINFNGIDQEDEMPGDERKGTLTLEMSAESGARPKCQLYELNAEDHMETALQLNSYVEQKQGGLMRQANQMLLQRMVSAALHIDASFSTNYIRA